MAVYLVRHAKAGDREAWDGDDRLRPLSKPGRRQAEGLVDQLEDFPISRILSSPYIRCLQTVEPLARERQLRIEESADLAEGAGPRPTLRMIRELSGQDAVLCTHGDVVQELIEHLIEVGKLPPAAANDLAKGSTWILDTQRGRIVSARYLPAPSDQKP